MTTINVTGTASRDVDPDYALIHVTLNGSSSIDGNHALNGVSVLIDNLRNELSSEESVTAIQLSRVNTRRVRWYDHDKAEYFDGDWTATVSGTVRVNPEAAGRIVGLIDALTIQVSYLTWHLDKENTAMRDVRKEAVDVAHAAAQDFADALGKTLGEALTIADPGLLTGGRESRGNPFMRGAVLAAAAPGGPAEPDLDTQLITVTATVEASYEAN